MSIAEWIIGFLIVLGPLSGWVLFFAISSAMMAKRMGRSWIAWFTVGAFFGPFGWFVLLTEPRRRRLLSPPYRYRDPYLN